MIWGNGIARHDRALLTLIPWLGCLGVGAYLFIQASSVRTPVRLPDSMIGADSTPTFRLKTPLAHSVFPVGTDGWATVPFQWDVTDLPSTKGALPVFLEISTDAQFSPKNTELTHLPDFQFKTVREMLPPGHYYWRLRIGDRQFSRTRDFWVQPEKADSDG